VASWGRRGGLVARVHPARFEDTGNVTPARDSEIARVRCKTASLPHASSRIIVPTLETGA